MFGQSDAGIKHNTKYFNVTWQWDSDARNVHPFIHVYFSEKLNQKYGNMFTETWLGNDWARWVVAKSMALIISNLLPISPPQSHVTRVACSGWYSRTLPYDIRFAI